MYINKEINFLNFPIDAITIQETLKEQQDKNINNKNIKVIR